VLIRAGIEFEKYDPYKNFEIVTIDEVEQVTKKLRLCKIKGRQVLCGAQNAEPGLRCILAKPGAIIPSNKMEIVRREMCGYMSEGMLCGADELLIDDDSQGLLEVTPGQTIDFLLGKNGPFYDLDITPNRGDLMNVYGIARELAAFGLGTLKSPQIYSSNSIIDFKNSHKLINVVANDNVLGMYGILLEDVQNTPSPNWLKQMLFEVGMNSNSSAVDVTNYIAYSLGQPTHAFDYDITGNLAIKTNSMNEPFVDLKGREVSVHGLTCIFAKNGNICSLPGVIGGNYGKSTPETNKILLEAGIYTKEHIYHSAKAASHTSASRQFFHGIDPLMTKIAIQEAAYMIVDLCKCSIKYAECEVEPVLEVRIFRFNETVTGMDISPETVSDKLEKLGFSQDENGQFLVPSWRNDIIANEDLAEEVLRMLDYNSVPIKPFIPIGQGSKNSLSNMNSVLCSLGLWEVMNIDFISKNMADFFESKIKITNPMKSQAQSYMRNSILPSLLDNVSNYQKYNWKVRGLFEVGHVFTEDDKEAKRLGIVIFGDNLKENWATNKQNFEYFRAKELAEMAMRAALGFSSYTTMLGDYKFLQNSCEFRMHDKVIGWFGEVSPTLCKEADVKPTIYAAEVFLDERETEPARSKVLVTDQQRIQRDISFNVPVDTPWCDIKSALDKTLIPECIEFKVFDVYPEGSLNIQRSLAIRLTWTAISHTLSTDEINSTVSKVENVLTKLNCSIKV
jgi:phenylalanyl-tRNA synthetase beta chain